MVGSRLEMRCDVEVPQEIDSQFTLGEKESGPVRGGLKVCSLVTETALSQDKRL